MIPLGRFSTPSELFAGRLRRKVVRLMTRSSCSDASFFGNCINAPTKRSSVKLPIITASRYSRAWIWESDVHDRSTINNFRNLLKEKQSCRRIIRRFQSPPYRARSPSPERSRRRRAVSPVFNPELLLTRRHARRRRAFSTRDNIKKEADQHMPICLGQSP